MEPVMTDPKNRNSPDTASAETARQEGAQGRLGKTPDDGLRDGEVDASDPEIAVIADKVHANA
jgi:hypothetical protein